MTAGWLWCGVGAFTWPSPGAVHTSHAIACQGGVADTCCTASTCYSVQTCCCQHGYGSLVAQLAGLETGCCVEQSYQDQYLTSDSKHFGGKNPSRHDKQLLLTETHIRSPPCSRGSTDCHPCRAGGGCAGCCPRGTPAHPHHWTRLPQHPHRPQPHAAAAPALIPHHHHRRPSPCAASCL